MKLDLNTLFEMFQQIENENLQERETGPASQAVENVSQNEIENFMESMRFRISENWGKPSSESNIDRASIDRFLKNIKGSNLQEKIQSLQSFVTECEDKCIQEQSISEILGNLQFLDSFASIVYEFNSQTGGFLFESLLASLLEGEQKSIAGGETNIEDLFLRDGEEGPVIPVSVKLLKNRGNQDFGSVNNNIEGILKFKQPITYFLAVKSPSEEGAMKIDFYRFTIGIQPIPPKPSNFKDAETRNKNIERINSEVAQKYNIPEQGYPGYYNLAFSDIGKGGRVDIKSEQIANNQTFLATLLLSPKEQISNVAQKYSQRLGTDLIKMYSDLVEIKNAMNSYFLDSPEAKQQINKAASHANSLKEKIETIIK